MPDSPILGALALLFAIPSALCAPTYFLSHLAYVGAAIAVPLGVMARGVDRSRGLGTGALVLAIVAIAMATATLVTVG